MTTAGFRDLALAMEGAFESSHHGHPDFRVSKGIFATLAPGEEHGVLRLPLHLAEELASSEAGHMQVVSRSEHAGWLRFSLAAAAPQDVRDLVELAWEVRRQGTSLP